MAMHERDLRWPLCIVLSDWVLSTTQQSQSDLAVYWLTALPALSPAGPAWAVLPCRRKHVYGSMASSSPGSFSLMSQTWREPTYSASLAAEWSTRRSVGGMGP